MELTLVTLLAVVLGPLVVGYWIGHPLFAGLVFVALSLTVAVGAIGRGDSGEDPAMGVVLTLALSAVSAAVGGHLRARSRQRREQPR